MKTLLYYILSGFLLAFAWPTNGFSLLIFIAFVPLLFKNYNLVKHGYSHTKLFFLNYLSFVVWNFISTGWLYYSSSFGMLFAVLVNSALMSLVMLVVIKFIKKLNFIASASLFISLWLSFEYLHYHWEFSWPWLTLGNVFSESISFIQWYEYTGVFGGSLWVLLVNIVILKSVLLFNQYKEKTIIYRAIFKTVLLVGLPIVLSVLIKPNTSTKSYIETIVLQPNIDPYQEKYNLSDAQIKQQLLEQVMPLLKPEHRQLILAPETVFANGTEFKSYKYSHAKDFTKQVLLKNPNAQILMGISAYELIRDQSQLTLQSNFLRKNLWYNDYNSAVFQNNDTLNFYHKSKLVVGVENFPYKGLLEPILGNVMLDLGGTVATKTTQANREVFSTNIDLKVAPIICYESVYGEYVTKYVKNKANVLAIITNDAWWNDTQGYQQHWSYAKLRAIETRKAVARSANTGISGFIDRDGSELSRSKYNTKTALVEKLPIYTSEPTFYVTYGNVIPRLALLLAGLILLFSMTRRR